MCYVLTYCETQFYYSLNTHAIACVSEGSSYQPRCFFWHPRKRMRKHACSRVNICIHSQILDNVRATNNTTSIHYNLTKRRGAITPSGSASPMPKNTPSGSENRIHPDVGASAIVTDFPCFKANVISSVTGIMGQC